MTLSAGGPLVGALIVLLALLGMAWAGYRLLGYADEIKEMNSLVKRISNSRIFRKRGKGGR